MLIRKLMCRWASRLVLRRTCTCGPRGALKGMQPFDVALDLRSFSAQQTGLMRRRSRSSLTALGTLVPEKKKDTRSCQKHSCCQEVL